MISFGKRLRDLRASKNMTQKDIGELLGKSKNTISQYELGIRQADDETKEVLADFFGVTVDYLLGRTELKRYPKTGESEQMRELIAQKLDEILEKTELLSPGEDLSDDQVEWAMKLLDKAIEMTKLND